MIRIKKESAAYAVLKSLVDLGGVAPRATLSTGIRAAVFYHVMESLTSRFLVEVIHQQGGDVVKATVAGKEQVFEYEYMPMVSAPLQMVLPRVPKPFTPLRMSLGAAPYRPGSDEHKQIPSLMGAIRRLPSGEVIE